MKQISFSTFQWDYTWEFLNAIRNRFALSWLSDSLIQVFPSIFYEALSTVTIQWTQRRTTLELWPSLRRTYRKVLLEESCLHIQHGFKYSWGKVKPIFGSCHSASTSVGTVSKTVVVERNKRQLVPGNSKFSSLWSSYIKIGANLENSRRLFIKSAQIFQIRMKPASGSRSSLGNIWCTNFICNGANGFIIFTNRERSFQLCWTIEVLTLRRVHGHTYEQHRGYHDVVQLFAV